MPTSSGTELYSGTTTLFTNLIQLSRSWKKDGVMAAVVIANAKSGWLLGSS